MVATSLQSTEWGLKILITRGGGIEFWGQSFCGEHLRTGYCARDLWTKEEIMLVEVDLAKVDETPDALAIISTGSSSGRFWGLG